MTTISDDEILTLIRGKGTANQGFALLMKKYREPIYWHVRRLVVSHEDAEDILQEVFINVFRFFESYKGDSKLYTWIYKIATNECARMFRSRKGTHLSFDEVGEVLVNTLYDSSSDESDRILLLFQEAILRLPEKQRLVFNLRYYDELSYEEISQILDSSVGTLKTNYHYAQEKIKEFMIQHQL
ncbi:MAG: RNA polymerase sigma factor [Bacteroidota bacterium]|nr:RNA polymerase sigma factor [Bacteroidota bacterium]